jgi:nucleoside-diphosphate-sugar epimerase
MTPEKFSGKRLVLFGCGYVGTQLAHEAIAAKLTVTALTRNARKASALEKMGVDKVVLASLDSSEWHSQIDPKQDYVVNCVSSGRGDTEAYQKSYLEGMRSVLEWGRESQATFVYTGSTSVYDQDKGEVVTEASSVVPANEKAQVLRETEELLQEAAAKSFGRWFILRLAGVYGPERHYLLDQLRKGETRFSGSGQHRLNLIHRDDICSAIWACLGAPSEVQNEIFNCSDDLATPKADVLNWLAERIQASPPVWEEVVSDKGWGGRLIRDRIISHEKLTQVLGWEPLYPTFREGYEQILEP